MKRETRKLPNGVTVEMTRCDNLVHVAGTGLKSRQFNSWEEAYKFIAELGRKSLSKDPDVKKREERFEKMGLTEAGAEVAARDKA